MATPSTAAFTALGFVYKQAHLFNLDISQNLLFQTLVKSNFYPTAENQTFLSKFLSISTGDFGFQLLSMLKNRLTVEFHTLMKNSVHFVYENTHRVR